MGSALREGIVIREYKHHYVVEVDGEELLCTISSKLRKLLEYPEAHRASRRHRVQAVREIPTISPVVVGDRVRVEPGKVQGMIREVLPRRSALSREAPGRNAEQVIAANVDQVLAVTSAQQPPFDAELLDRILCGAEFQEIEACICLNKVDLGTPPQVDRLLAAYPPIGYPVIRTSATTGEGLEALRAQVRDRTSVMVGLSGVGKTSLINALAPGLDLRVRPVSDRTGYGRHTTTNVALIRLPFGGHIVDAPGLRELSLWSAEPEDIPDLFPEFRPFVGQCRFGGSCAHRQEPGCAVKEAVEKGQIAPHRYSNYLILRREAEQKAERQYERRRPRPPE